jgi:hypothetical protein
MSAHCDDCVVLTDVQEADGLVERTAVGAASFQAKSRNRKLSPVIQVPGGSRPRPIAKGPFITSSYVSIAATCSDGCIWKRTGACYASAGATKGPMAKLDAAARGHTSDEVIAEQVRLIDRFSVRGIPQDGGRQGDQGRDHRLNVGGDFLTAKQAQLIGSAAERYRDRGGGAFFGFTHSWQNVPRAALGDAVSMLASIERAEDIEPAKKQGYAPALTVDYFPSKKPYLLPGHTALLIPCPYEAAGKTTCVECRLCMDADALYAKNKVIVFEAHGSGAKKMRDRLAKPIDDDLIQIRRARDAGAVGKNGGAGAAYLDLTPTALRGALERRAVRSGDGRVEAEVGGVRARKLGRLWRVQFDEAWLAGGRP